MDLQTSNSGGQACADQTHALMTALNTMFAQHEAGAIDHMLPLQQFVGDHAEIARVVNQLVCAHIAVKMKVVEVIGLYARGDFSVDMDRLPGKKAQITDALDNVRDVLKKESAAAKTSSRIKNALDVATTNVMVADADLNIVYTNKSLATMLAEVEQDIRKDLPAFSARNVIGTNVDVFHKNPSHQRGMLANLRDSHRTQLAIGGRRFNLIVNPVFDEHGGRLGTVVEWKDATAELAAREREETMAAENARVRNALDNVTTNVMIADNDGQIVYTNKSVVEMLSKAESDLRKALPQFDASRIVGVNFDTFHKNPSHQRNMLGNLRGTHKTEIVVSGMTFSLIAVPVIGANGERVGTVVEWKNRTEEVDVEREVASVIGAAAEGDFTQRVPTEGKAGFFKLLAESINQLVGLAEQGLNELGRFMGELSQGNLTDRVVGEFKGKFAELQTDSNRTTEQLHTLMNQIKEAADAINTAAKEIAAGNSDLSQRTEEQASSLEETASSMEELTSTVRQNAENAKQANQLAIGASEVAVRGGNVVQDVVGTMSAINDSAKKIVDIIGVIDGIAFQTNILALNAAVEAARAGEQGRGFAVVATEVRNLAQRSAAAAKEIKTLISDSVQKVDAGTKLVDEAGVTMAEIVTSVKRVTDIMSEISAASVEQSSGIEQVNQAITQMDEVTQQNAALVEQAAAAAESLEEQAQSLTQSVSVFQLDDGKADARPAVDRRGPGRATNVARLPAAKGTSATKPVSKPVPKRAPAKARAAAGGDADDEWAEF